MYTSPLPVLRLSRPVTTRDNQWQLALSRLARRGGRMLGQGQGVFSGLCIVLLLHCQQRGARLVVPQLIANTHGIHTSLIIMTKIIHKNYITYSLA